MQTARYLKEERKNRGKERCKAYYSRRHRLKGRIVSAEVLGTYKYYRFFTSATSFTSRQHQSPPRPPDAPPPSCVQDIPSPEDTDRRLADLRPCRQDSIHHLHKGQDQRHPA